MFFRNRKSNSESALKAQIDKLMAENAQLRTNNERLVSAITVCVDTVKAIDASLNDPYGDGTGDGAQPPTGDEYNDVFDAIETMAAIQRSI